MKNLTQGKPTKLILSFALPIFLGNLLQLTYSIADTRIVGTFLGGDALAAVGATTTISTLIVGFLMGVTNGFAITTAQYFGGKNEKGIRKSFAIALLLGIVIAFLITAGGLIFIHPILTFLNVPMDLFAFSKKYITIIIAGTIVTLLYDTCAAVMRSIGDSITPLMILGISVVLNIFGDLFFVRVLHFGVEGTAIATVLSQLIALIFCMFYMFRKYPVLRLKKEDFVDISMETGKKMLTMGLSMGFMSSLVNIGSLTLQTAINELGANLIVAHTAARKISEIFMIMFSVFGQTMATYSGQNLGAGEYNRIREGIKISLFATFLWCTLSMLASYTIGPSLIYLVTGSKNQEVIVNATNYLKFNTIFYYVTAYICIIRNVMQGIGDAKTPLISSSLEMIGKIIIAGTLVPMFGYVGVIVAEPIVWFIMIIPLIVQARKNPVLQQKK